MRDLLKNLSLTRRGIKHKLVVAFALMSVIPMLVCGYLIIYYIFPTIDSLWNISLIFIITIFLMLMGYYLTRKIVYPVASISAYAKGIAEGRLVEEATIEAEDEVGELSGSLNRLSRRLKENMSELHSYGEKIKQINMEINKKVFALSALLQIGNLMTANAKLDEVFGLIVEKLSQLESGGAFIVFREEESGELLMRAKVNIEATEIGRIKVKVGQGPLGKLFAHPTPLVIDKQNKLKAADGDLRKLLQTKNMLLVPVTSFGTIIGLLGVGNNTENFVFAKDEKELIGVFAKQVAVAVENDILLRKTEELNVRDELTGLYNENYIRTRLEEEIRRAISYQRPCSFLIFEVANFERYRDVAGAQAAEVTLKKMAQTLKDATGDIDKAARFSDHQFAVLLPEKNKEQSLNVAEGVCSEMKRRKLTQAALKGGISLTLSAGISAVPVDGRTAVELINRALHYTEKSKNGGQNKIVLS
ncbi:MAG: diguanylate cyclase [Candidatus Omnitrophota bacterium]|nr:MAG: diguanylate cyclase [Candidatus Omnitrophota bacterium]